MKRFFKRALATVLVVLMLLTSGPLQGFADLDLGWFSSKASALRIRLSAEEAVDIYLENISMWRKSYDYGSCHYFFIDLDFDNVLELVRTDMYGTGSFSDNNIYKIHFPSKKVYEVNTKTANYDMDFFFSGDSALKLYENSKGLKFYLTYDYFRNGYAYNETVEKGFYYENSKLVYKNLYAYANITDNNYNETRKYYTFKGDGTAQEISYGNYTTARNTFYKSCTDLHLKFSTVSRSELFSYTAAKRREKLIELYKSFSYDGMCDMRFAQDEKQVHLGQRVDALSVYNGLQLIHEPVNNSKPKFDASKLKFVVEDESIAQITEIKALPGPAAGYSQNATVVYGAIKTNCVGETKVTAVYDGEEIVECVIVVEYPNQLEVKIPELGMEMYEIDGVFFNNTGASSVGSIRLPITIQNKFIEGLSYTIDARKEILDLLKLKNIRLSFEIKGSDVLSFSNEKMERKLDLHREELEFNEKSEPGEFELYIFSENPNRFLVDDIDNVEIVCSIYFDHPTDEGVDEYNPDAEETRDARGSESDTFDMLSYKNKYVEDHKRAMDPYTQARMLYDFSLSESLIKLEDELEYKFYQGIEKSLLENVTDFVIDFDEIVAYEILLADTISKYYGNDEIAFSMFKAEFSNSYLKYAKKIFDKFLSFSKNKYDEKTNKELEKITHKDVTDIISGKVSSGIIYKCFMEFLDKYHVVLDNVIFVNDTINSVLDGYNNVVGAVENIAKTLNVYAAFEAYATMNEYQKNALTAMRKTALQNGNHELAAAINDFLIYDNNALDRIAVEGCVAAVLVGGSVDKLLGEAKNIVKSTLKTKLVDIVGEKLFKAGSIYLTSVTAGFEVGKLLSDSLCNYKDFSAACAKIITAGKVSEALRPVIQQTYYDLLIENELEPAYEKARAFDFAFSMYKQLEYIAADATKTALEAKDNAPLMYFLNDAKKEGREKIAELTTKLTKINNIYCHDEYLESVYSKICYYTSEYGSVGDDFATGFSDYKTICVQCPVDVFVRNSNGEIVASVENNVATKEASGVVIIVIGDEKYICLPATEEYDVEIIATDSGTMDYAVFEYGSTSSESVRGVTFDKVELTKNKGFTAKLDTELLTDKDNYNLVTGTQEITATKDVYVPVEAIAISGEANILVGNVTTLNVITTPEDASALTYKWISSDESVATVCGGDVRGLKAGKATITCEAENDSSIKAAFEITVSECAHSFSEWETVEEVTCSKVGRNTRKCTVCGTTEAEEITQLKAHTPSAESVNFEATCTKNKATITFCSECGEVCSKVEVPGTAKGHGVTVFNFERRSTTERAGLITETCSVCDTVVNETKISRIVEPYLSQTEFIYDGKVKSPTLTIYNYNGDKLKLNTDYKVETVSGTVKPGTYNVKVIFMGDYEGTCNLSYKIKMKDISLTATSTTSTITLNWSAVPGAAGYKVYYKVGSAWKALGTTSGLTASFKNIAAGRKYTFAVIAGAKLNGEVIWADSYATVDTATQAVKPAKVVAAQNTSAIKLSWSACPGATGYRIYYKSGSTWKVCVSSTNATSHTFKNLSAGAKYTFAVRPYVLNNKTVIWSDYTQFMTATKPADIKVSTLSYSGGAYVYWSDVAGADGYQVFYKINNGAYKLYKTYSTAQYLKFDNLKSGAKYTFAVRAGIRTSGGNIYGGYIEKSFTAV